MAIPNIWRTKNERYQLQGNICSNCSTPIFPARHTCTNCSRMAGSDQHVDHAVESISHQSKRHYAMPAPQPAVSLANTGDD